MSPGRGVCHFLGAVENEAKIAFLAPVQIPVVRIRPWVERIAKPAIDKDADQEHPAVDSNALYVRLRVISRPDPRLRFTHDMAALVALKAHL